MKRSLSFFAAPLAALLLAGASARAADIPWSYNWTPSTTSLASNTPGSSLTLTNEPGGNAAGNTNSDVTNLRAVSNAPPVALGSPSFTGSTPVNFTLALTDTASGMVHNFVYTVLFGGYVNSGAAAVTAAFQGPTSFTNVQIGQNLYTISNPVYTPPGPPGATNAGSISVQVSVTPGSGGKPPVTQGAPEPSTMVLSCVGLSFLGLAGWRRRRQAALQLA
jgi:PEP-CTERM motif-containing protein